LRARRGTANLGEAAFACVAAALVLFWIPSGNRAVILWRSQMAWKAPKIVEVPVGMEINMYACAARK
jgi:coenzyme PQQ precursor peptide PqqA